MGGNINWGIAENDVIFSISGDIYGNFKKGDELCKLQEVRLLAPAEPRIMVACGMNYMDHILEEKVPIPKEPRIFFKPFNTLIGTEDNIMHPTGSENIRGEAELCCVIKREARNIAEKDALAYVLGYTCGNDITAR